MKNQKENIKRDLDLNQRKEKLRRLLATNERCTFQYLANSLGVSKRTVKRYLDEIEEDTMLNFYIGRAGGVSLANRSKAKRFYLKEDELTLLRRILSQTEKTGGCVLDLNDQKTLKEMITYYSK